ncbi:MAG: glycosyltransferase [bacterium]|nr:glycosyltransferase [bacterium]
MLSFLFFLINRPLFDARYYRRHAPDLGRYRFVPLLHYLKAGWREGRSPHALFDNDWYLKKYLQDRPQNPLLHYIGRGRRQGCDPHPLFSTRFFLKHYAHLLRPGQSPLACYVKKWQQTPLMHTRFARDCLSEDAVQAVQGEESSPLAFYLDHPGNEVFQPFPLFDLDYYRKSNPTAARNWPLLLKHYIHYGADEGCRPHPLFDPGYYRGAYLNAGSSPLQAFFHYAEEGEAKGLRPNALFDPGYYWAQLSAEEQEGAAGALVHYARQGIQQGLYPCREVAELARKPCISILTPVFNTEADQLWRCVHSVLLQPYPHWQLCLVDDGSTASHIKPLLQSYARLDSRIRVDFLPKNSGIATATNRAAELAGGDYLAFLDHDDELAPDALYQVALAINEEDADLCYSDESLVNLESRHLDTLYKCRLNRELLLSHNHLMHFFVVRRELFDVVGGLDPACDGAQDYDLALKLTEICKKVCHIPRVLYHWRAHATSSSIHHEQKHYADEAGRLALQAALARRHLDAEAQTTELRFFYRARRKLPKEGLVSVCMDWAPPEAAKARRRSELEASWKELEWLDGAASADSTLALQALPLHLQRNQAAAAARGAYLFFLGEGVDSLRAESLPALLEYGLDPAIAMAGGWLEQPESEHQHRGSLPDPTNPSPFYYAAFLRDASVQHNRFHCAQYAWAVAEQFCLIRRELFLSCGGYDPAFHTLAFAHLDLSFRLQGQELSLVYTPHAVACIGQAFAPGSGQVQAAEQDRQLFQGRWHEKLSLGDPWYNTAMLVDHGLDPARFRDWLLD